MKKEHIEIRVHSGIIHGTLYYRSEITKNCVIYLHGNASNQKEGFLTANSVLENDICLFCFDFPGCGVSYGNYITLGGSEARTAEIIINELQTRYHFENFVLWGFSMGASAALMVRHNLMRCVISDSAFTSLAAICRSFARNLPLPKLLVKILLIGMKFFYRLRVHYDFDSVSPIKAIRNATVPALFGHGTVDSVVPFSHGNKLFNRYPVPKKDFVQFLGSNHNSPRPYQWKKKAMEFILSCFASVDNSSAKTSNSSQTNNNLEFEL